MRRVGLVALVTVVLLASAAMAYAGNGKAVPGWHSNSDKYTAISVTNPNDPADVSDTLVRERTPDAVLDQHMTALNGCDWNGLMQQYPDSYELRLPGGTVVKGRRGRRDVRRVREAAAEGGCAGSRSPRSLDR